MERRGFLWICVAAVLLLALPASSAAARSVSIGNATVTEPDGANTVAAKFKVTLSKKSSHTVTVMFDTSDGSATLGDNDYELRQGAVRIKPHRKSKTVKVTVNGDDKHENDETFSVDLSNAHGASIHDGEATGMITNNDPGAPVLEGFSTALSGSCITQGQTNQPVGTVTLSSPAMGDTFVVVESDDTNAVTITNGGVTVPNGMDSAQVHATGVSGPDDVTLTATLGAGSSLTAPLHVAPAASPCS